MTFSELIKAADLGDGRMQSNAVSEQINIKHVCCDSRIVCSASVFVCMKGLITDGHIFARNAYDNGCRCFVAQEPIEVPDDCAIVYTRDTRFALALLADLVYGHPSEKLTVIGITGTKGKTTVALTVKGILDGLGMPTGYIGTNGVLFGGFQYSSVNTTPECCDIQRYLCEMVEAGIKFVVIEVSSQALYVGRVRFVKFDTCVFTNLSPDHISSYEHPTFEHYRDSKARLFSEFSPRYAVVNADDDYSEYMLHGCRADIVTYGLRSPAMYTADDLAMYRTTNTLGMQFDICHDGVRTPAQINFPGEFSVSNALAAVAVCGIYSEALDDMVKLLGGITVRGRFELVPALPYATVIIDYAHNGASMTAVLETLQQYPHRKIISLFGSVGGRTEMRRAELGNAASALSDLCILTEDNPNREDPRIIAQNIADGFVQNGCDYEVITDRQEAICHALELLREGDILLLAGKGHEDYQLANGVRRPFSEREIVMRHARRMLESELRKR